MPNKDTHLTNEQVRAAATIFAVCRRAIGSRSSADVVNAQHYPLQYATIYTTRLHALGCSTPEIERILTEQYCQLDEETLHDNFHSCLSLEQQGVWDLAYSKALYAAEQAAASDK